MKRFHVHVSVKDIDESIRFYSTLFGSEPSRVEADYAKWMLEDPRVNFAISRRREAVGVDHLGFQVDNAEEFTTLKAQLLAADAGLVEQAAAACCYATGDKYWVTDPAGVAWETFHTLGSIPVYGSDIEITRAVACCEPGQPTTDGACAVRGASTEPSGACGA